MKSCVQVYFEDTTIQELDELKTKKKIYSRSRFIRDCVMAGLKELRRAEP